MEQETRWPILLQTGTTSKRDWPWPCFQPAACLRLISYNNSRANVDVDFCLPILDMMSFSSPFWPKFGALWLMWTLLDINFEIVFTSGRILYLFHLNCRIWWIMSRSFFCAGLHLSSHSYRCLVKVSSLKLSAEYRYHLFCPLRKRYTWTKTRYIGRINLFKSAPVQ